MQLNYHVFHTLRFLLQINQPLRWVCFYTNKNSTVLEAHIFYMQWETELLGLCVLTHSRGVGTIQQGMQSIRGHKPFTANNHFYTNWTPPTIWANMILFARTQLHMKMLQHCQQLTLYTHVAVCTQLWRNTKVLNGGAKKKTKRRKSQKNS